MSTFLLNAFIVTDELATLICWRFDLKFEYKCCDLNSDCNLSKSFFTLPRKAHRKRQMAHIYAQFLQVIWMQMAQGTWFFSLEAEEAEQRNQRN